MARRSQRLMAAQYWSVRSSSYGSSCASGSSPQGEETLDQVVWMVVLALGKKGVWTVTLLRRCGAGATNTHGVALAWGRRPNLLDADLVAPGDVEVVLIEEALARPKAEIGQANLVGAVGKADLLAAIFGLPLMESAI